MPGEAQTNALLAACAVTLSGQSIVARGIDVHDAAVLAFTKIENVDSPATNVVPKIVRVRGTIRTLRHDVRASLYRQLERLTVGVAAGYGCSAAVTFQKGYPVTNTTRQGHDRARLAAESAVGADSVFAIGTGVNEARPSMGAEDFGFLLNACADGAYIWLGVGENSPGLHTPDFAFPAAALSHGAAWFALLAHSQRR
jgi:metal-dependent amidase/aminoacylase/carboxypeptidase family protein